uniref:NADH-ubiquinone oxidoreductase chain 2 n=1 Tax=Astronesthes nigroides TaxID=2996717 RepID=A0AA51ZUA7_9TELE|nr:NADH dehydrogenase subunit 2 [Astronesthes nigroides]WMY89409.1 NADH dehydrogenase subunit 2 [Astronesthes nigroides]
MHPLVITCLLSALGLGTVLTFSSSHWLLAWMGLEVNTLAILPLMAQKHHPRAVEATTKYFLIQSTAAAMIMFASLTNAWVTGEWMIFQLSHPIPVTITMLALALKVGLAPAHFWLPEVLQGLDLTTGLILSTWQKLAPFALIVQVAPSVNSHLLIALGLTSTFIGGWGGLNQTQLRKILAYSSIAHLGWMILIVQFAPSIALLNLFLYIAMTSTAFLALKAYDCLNLNDLSTSWAKSPALAALLTPVLLSLGGLPPLSGFMPKWLVINEMVKQGLQLPATIAALSALLSLYYYLRVCYAVALTSPPNILIKTTPWRLAPSQKHLFLALPAVVALGILPITPAILAWFT